MKVSKQWISQYLDYDLPEIDELARVIGAQVGQVEAITDLAPRYDNVVIVKVVECQKLENSDHLNVCLVDDGGKSEQVARNEAGLIQVVCGAPNVSAGIFVAWLPPGSTVPSSFGAEPFVLESRELRGTMSHGMLASAKELGIGDSHEGLLILDGALSPGDSFSQTYKLHDQIIDIENKMFTHRPDCFGELGIAREVSASMHKRFVSPKWYLEPEVVSPGSGLELKVTNEVPEVCPRYMAVALDGITITPSPVWLQSYLSRVGVRPINLIVDITNYVMLVTGQPLHAFDYDKVVQNGVAEIVVRNPHAEESLLLLDGKTITPRAEAVLIATADHAIGLGGVMGGGNSEIDVNTKRIIIECANFDMYNIRRTSMQHGIFTDAVTRFNKGQSSWQCPAVLAKAVTMVRELCVGANVASEVIDLHQPKQQNQAVPIELSFINSRLGLTLTSDAARDLLQNAEFSVIQEADRLQVTAPFWRTDIELREDVVEEVGRLYGFDEVPLELPKRVITPVPRNAMFDLKSKIRHSLRAAGANEVLTYSFVHGKLIDRVTQDREKAFKITNALSPDLQYFRMHALPSLLDKVHMNIKAGYNEFALFEINKGHNLLHERDGDGGVPTEIEFLDFVYTSKKAVVGAPFYYARAYLDVLAKDLGMTLSYTAIKEDPHVPVADPYDYQRSAYVADQASGQMLGMVGEFKPSVLRDLKLPPSTAGFTIGPNQMLLASEQLQAAYVPLPRFPKVEQDICFRVPVTVAYQTLATFVSNELQTMKPEQTIVAITPHDIYQRADDSDHLQITFRIALTSYEKTMTDAQLSGLLATLSDKAHQEFGAERV